MKRFTNIALVVEHDADNKTALDRAASLAARNHAKLTLVVVAPDLGPIANDALREALAEGAREELRHLLSQAPDYLHDLHAQQLEGDDFLQITRAVMANGYDLLIKPAEPTVESLETLGPVDKKLLRKCPCPVWLVRGDTHPRYERVMVAIDYRPDSPDNEALNRQLLEMSGSLAHMEGASLEVAHAWRLQGEDTLRSSRTGLDPSEVDELVRATARDREAWLRDTVATYFPKDEGMRKPTLKLVEGNARSAVPELARSLNSELVIMGTVGRTGIPGYFIGNTAEAILGRIDCDILAVKPPGFESPVSME